MRGAEYARGMSDQHRAIAMPAKLILYILTAGLIVAGLVFPFVGGAGAIANRLSDVAAEDSAQLLEGEVPIVSTMVDAAGNPIAWLYAQRRWVVPGNRIADTMKLAIVSIEDKRFADAQRRRPAGHPDRTGRLPAGRRSTPAAGRRSSSSTSRTTTSW